MTRPDDAAAELLAGMMESVDRATAAAAAGQSHSDAYRDFLDLLDEVAQRLGTSYSAALRIRDEWRETRA